MIESNDNNIITVIKSGSRVLILNECDHPVPQKLFYMLPALHLALAYFGLIPLITLQQLPLVLDLLQQNIVIIIILFIESDPLYVILKLPKVFDDLVILIPHFRYLLVVLFEQFRPSVRERGLRLLAKLVLAGSSDVEQRQFF